MMRRSLRWRQREPSLKAHSGPRTLLAPPLRLVIAGHYTDAGEIAINPHVHLNRKHVDLRGCWGSEFRHFHRSFEWLGRVAGELPFASMVSKMYALGDANAALDDIRGAARGEGADRSGGVTGAALRTKYPSSEGCAPKQSDPAA